jgi:hypothetical protein
MFCLFLHTHLLSLLYYLFVAVATLRVKPAALHCISLLLNFFFLMHTIIKSFVAVL